MLIDCGTCTMRGPACSDCLVSALFDMPDEVGQLGAEEHRAIEVLARAGFEVEVLPAPTPLAVPRRPPGQSRPARRRRVA
jgi:hypothetical protein